MASWHSELRSIVPERFGVEVPEDIYSKVPEGGGSDPWSIGTVLAWIKNRLHERGLLKAGQRGSELPIRIDPTPMHVFFISIEETEEHLRMLRLKDDDERRKYCNKVARSKLFGSPLVTRPIDKTAWRVTEGNRTT